MYFSVIILAILCIVAFYILFCNNNGNSNTTKDESSPQEGGNPYMLVLVNISSITTKAELRKRLESYGPIKCITMEDNVEKGTQTARIIFHNEEAAKNAKADAKVNNISFNGKFAIALEKRKTSKVASSPSSPTRASFPTPPIFSSPSSSSPSPTRLSFQEPSIFSSKKLSSLSSISRTGGQEASESMNANKKKKKWMPKTGKAKSVQVLFSFDTTGSMYEYLEAVKASLTEIVKKLRQDAPSIRIGLICHGDYCDKKDYIYKVLYFTKNLKKMTDFVAGCGKTNGGDSDECYELVLRKAKKMFLKTKAKASAQVLVVIGDANPHEKDYPQNTQKIDWREEIKELDGNKVTVLGVQCGSDSSAAKFYETISTSTGRKRIELKDINDVKEVILGMCLKAESEEKFRKFKVESYFKGISQNQRRIVETIETVTVRRFFDYV